MNQKKTGKLTFTILSISLLTVMAGAAMAPALGVIREHFAGQSSLTVQLIVSLPALFIILTNFFFPSLCRIMRTKTPAITGLCKYIAFGAEVPYLNTIASIKGGRNAATTVMPLLSAAMFLGQFVSPLIVSPCASLFAGVTAPYKVGVIIGILFIIQTFSTRKYQAPASAPPGAVTQVTGVE